MWNYARFVALIVSASAGMFGSVLTAALDFVQPASWNFVVGVETDLGANNALKLQAIKAVLDRVTATDLPEAVERKAVFPHLIYWIEPVETFRRMARTSPVRQPNSAVLNASKTWKEA